MRRAAETLGALLTLPSLDRGLAVTAPHVAKALRSPSAVRELAVPRSSLARTATAYACRAALKPSPASTLATVGPAHPGPGGSRSHVRVAPALAFLVLQQCALDPAFSDLVELEWVEPDHDGAVCLPDRVDIDGYLFRNDERVSLHAPSCLPACHRSGRATASVHRDALRVRDPDADPHALLSRLVRMQLLRVVLPWDAPDPGHDVLAELHAAAAAKAPGQREVLLHRARLLRQVHSITGELARSNDVDAAELVRSLRATMEALLRTGAALHQLSAAAVVHETVASTASPARIRNAFTGPGLDAELGAALRPRLVRSLAHRALADLVAEQCGAGARVPVSRLLGMVGTGEAADHRMLTWAMQDVQAREDDVDPRPLPGVIAPSLAAYLQPAGRLTVLNAALPGAAAAGLRHLPVIGSARALEGPGTVHQEVHGWIDGLAPAGRWLALGTAEEWSDLQGAPHLTGNRLRWPADPPRSGGSRTGDVELEGLDAVHDPDTRSLRIEDRSGVPVAIVPVGVISPYLVSGPLRALLILSDPWTYRPLVAAPQWTERIDGDTVAGAERRQVGDLVLTRRSWWLPAGSLPRREPPESLLSFLGRVERWRVLRGLPDEVFLRAWTGPLELDPRLRKPHWVSWGAPHTLEVAARTAARTHRLLITEALPAVAGGAGPVIETVRLLGWSTPGGPA